MGMEHCPYHIYTETSLGNRLDDPDDVVEVLRATKPEDAPPKPICKRPDCGQVIERRAKFSTGRYWALYCSSICNNIHSKARRKKQLTEAKKAAPPKLVTCQWKHNGGCKSEFKKEGNRRYCDEHKIAAFEEGALERQNRYLTKKQGGEVPKTLIPEATPGTPEPMPAPPPLKLVSETRIPQRVVEALQADIARMEFMDANVEAVTVSFTVDRAGRIVLGSPEYRRVK